MKSLIEDLLPFLLDFASTDKGLMDLDRFFLDIILYKTDHTNSFVSD